MGGRPSRPIRYDPGPQAWRCWEHENVACSEDEEQKELRWINDHWRHESVHIYCELWEWEDFRSDQQLQRSDPRKRRQLENYIQRKSIKAELLPQLHSDPQQQSKVDDWKEFYLFMHRRTRGKERLIEEDERKKREYLEKLHPVPDGRPAEKWTQEEWQSREGLAAGWERAI
ncbi:MAG: hypothetical protein Q9164_007683, partial [Protoblastenia rupestris]